MPTIASFENIDIKMQKEGGAQHKIVGEFPTRETRLVQGWIELQRDELNREWRTLKEGGAWFTIAGLRR